MKSVRRADFKEVGTLVRIHGTRGEIRLETEVPCTIKEWAFPEIEGKPVPFFIEQLRASGDGVYLLKLEGINDTDAAKRLTGLPMLLPRKQVKSKKLSEEWDLDGFTVVTTEGEILGQVNGVEEMPQQELLVVQGEESELLIPLVEAFIAEINPEEEKITVDLPEGFIDAQKLS